MCTVYDPGLEGHLEEVLAIGMNDQISKPINPDAMFLTMAKHIGN